MPVVRQTASLRLALTVGCLTLTSLAPLRGAAAPEPGSPRAWLDARARQALGAALADPSAHERVLRREADTPPRARTWREAVAAVGGPPRFVSVAGRRPAADVLLAFLRVAGDHGLPAARYRPDVIGPLVAAIDARDAQLSALPEGTDLPADWSPPADPALVPPGLAAAVRAVDARVAVQAGDLRRLDALLLRTVDLLLEDTRVRGDKAAPDLAVALRGLEADPRGWLAARLPAHPDYARLVTACALYRRLARDGPPVTRVAPLDAPVAADDPRAAVLAHRLAAEGLLASGASGPPDGAALETALRTFQRSRSLEETGRVDPPTADALSRPWTHWLARVRVALARWRESPTRTQNTYIRANVPQFETELWVDGRLDRRMRSIVGTTNRGKTPVLSADIEFIIFNPRWYVPDGVKRVDLDRRAARDPNFWKANGFSLRKRADGTVTAVQRPGPGNWLGRVIFKMRSGTNIFLHDTHRPHLFEERQRTFSHGCVNVEDAIGLAERLLRLDGNPSAAQVGPWLDSLETHRANLRVPVPVHLEYVTVVGDEQGTVRFLPDVYRRDVGDVARQERAPVD